MIREEEKIEKFIKTEIEKISPSYYLFENTLNSVTKSEVERIKEQKDYYFSNLFKMKKVFAVGLPLAVLALVLVFTNKGGQVITQNIIEEESLTEKMPINKDSSFQYVVDSIISDFDTEVALASSESEDEEYVYQQLEEVNNLDTIIYE